MSPPLFLQPESSIGVPLPYIPDRQSRMFALLHIRTPTPMLPFTGPAPCSNSPDWKECWLCVLQSKKSYFYITYL